MELTALYYDSSYIEQTKAEFLQNVANDVFFNNLEKWNFESAVVDTTNVNESYYNNNFNIISNPDNNSVIIENENNINANVKIISIDGAIIEEKNIKEDYVFHIDKSKGIYIIQITGTDSHEYFVKKIIKR